MRKLLSGIVVVVVFIAVVSGGKNHTSTPSHVSPAAQKATEAKEAKEARNAELEIEGRAETEFLHGCEPHSRRAVCECEWEHLSAHPGVEAIRHNEVPVQDERAAEEGCASTAEEAPVGEAG